MSFASPAASLQECVRQACRTAIEDHLPAWLFSALTDRSYEEGARNKAFAESCNSMVAAGLSAELMFDIRAGINGRLARLLTEKDRSLSVQRNQSRVPDLALHSATTGEQAWVEVKQVYDLTLGKYYPKVAEDRSKLLASRLADSPLQLQQAVFFTELPNFDYPGGRWYGHKACGGRMSYEGTRGIMAQYARVRSLLGAPTWPNNDRPFMVPLDLEVSAQTADDARRWMDQVFVPNTTWTFDPSGHLRGAAVGVAIWDW